MPVRIFKGKNANEVAKQFADWMKEEPEKMVNKMKVSSNSGPDFFAIIVDFSGKPKTRVPKSWFLS